MAVKWTKARKEARKAIFDAISAEFGLEMAMIPRYPHYAIAKNGTIWYVNPGSKKDLEARNVPPYPSKAGYLGVWVAQTNKRPRYKMVHKLMASTFLGPRPTKQHLIRHLDGDSYNNHLDNLAWGTQKENMEDLKLHKSQRNVLTPELEAEILWELATIQDTFNPEDLAMKYNVSKLSILRLSKKI